MDENDEKALVKWNIFTEAIVVPDGDNDEVMDFVDRFWRKYKYQLEDAKRYFSVVRMKQGELLAKIQEMRRPGLFEAVWKRFGLSKQTAYNYIEYYQHKDVFKKMNISPSKAYKLAVMLDDPDVTMRKNALVFNDGAEILFSEIEQMNTKEINAVVLEFRRMKKALAEKDTTLKAIKESHCREVGGLRRENASLETLVKSSKLKLSKGVRETIDAHLAHVKFLLKGFLAMDPGIDEYRIARMQLDGYIAQLQDIEEIMANTLDGQGQ